MKRGGFTKVILVERLASTRREIKTKQTRTHAKLHARTHVTTPSLRWTVVIGQRACVRRNNYQL